MPDLNIIKQKQEAVAYVAAQERVYLSHQADHAMKKEILDTLSDMHEKVAHIDQGFVDASNIHVPSAWENIGSFFRTILRFLRLVS